MDFCKTQQRDAGQYMCVAENVASRTSKEFLLRVQGQVKDVAINCQCWVKLLQ